MTTIAVARKGDTVAIAADTYSSLGETKGPSKYIANTEKILRAGDSYIGLVGSAAHGHVFASIIRRYPRMLRLNSTESIFETYLKLHPILKDEYFLNTHEDDDEEEYESSQMDALIANPYGIFGMFSWRDVDEYHRFWAMGSGQEYAMGAMFAVYDQLDEAEEIARIGVEAGCEFDEGSGLPVVSYSIPLKKKPGPAGKKQSRRAR